MMALESLLVLVLACFSGVSANVCPSITDNSGKKYPIGEKIWVYCVNGPGRYFQATCLATSLWERSLETSQCSGSLPLGPASDPNPPSPATPVFVTPAPTTAGGCMYVQSYMLPQDANRYFPELSTATWRCETGTETFIATCQNGAWTFPSDACLGRPQTLFDRLGNLFRPILQPRPTPGVTYRPCPFEPSLMNPADASATFPHLSRYRYACPDPEYAGRYYYGTCRDGTWYYNQNECARQNVFENFANVLGNLFRPIFQPQPTQPSVPKQDCGYIPRMRPADAGRSFPHYSQYQFRCRDPSRVRNFYRGTCNDGTWEYNENDCYSRNPFQGFGQGLSNIIQQNPWIFLLG